MRARLLAAFLVCAAWPRPAPAHVRSTSWSTWTLEDGGGAAVRLRVARLDLGARAPFARLAAGPAAPDDEAALAGYLTARVRLEGPAGPCPAEPGSYQAQPGEEGDLVRSWRVRCPAAPLRLISTLLAEELPSHLHFATVVRGGGPAAGRLLAGEGRAWELDGAAAGDRPAPSGLLAFVALGLRHVASGADHLVFVLALLVAAASVRALAAVVTGFTAGHSATLALAVLGGARPDAGTVEALVGASIAVVAVENVWLGRRDPGPGRALVAGLAALALAGAALGRAPALALGGLVLFVACYLGLLARSARPERLRFAVAALFGTVHGLAFSGALAEMHLPRRDLAGALLGFNAGVELAQLALILLAWPLWRRLLATGRAPFAPVLASAAALGAGAFWLVARALG